MNDGDFAGGEGADLGTMEDCDAWALNQAARIDQKERKRLEVEGHALFKASKLDAAAEADIRARLLKACANLESEVEISWLTLTSPTGVYGENPTVLAMFE